MSPALESREHSQQISEIKFTVSRDISLRIRDWAASRLTLDPHVDSSGIYRVASIFFDTPGWEVFRRVGSFGRSKYRIRRYQDDEQIFLERKLKTRARLSKRRSKVFVSEFTSLENPRHILWQGAWFQRRIILRGLLPVCQVSYARAAFAERGVYGPIRLTVDEDLRAFETANFIPGPHSGSRILPGKAVVEMKFSVAIPGVFKELIAEFCLSPAPFSKYRHAVSQFEKSCLIS